MKLHATSLAGAWLIELEPIVDERGHFARSFDAATFAQHGLDARVEQCNVSYNARAGTLRGMHYQRAPHGEAKLVHVTRGLIHDVLIDLRPGSHTYCEHFAVELGETLSLFAPAGLAHGFQTLADDCVVLYQMSAPYVALAARGVRWDDPLFAIDWPPSGGRIISPRDRGYANFEPSRGDQ